MIHDCTTHPTPHVNCYTAHGCRCNGCKQAANVYKQQLKSRHNRGEPVSVDRTVVRRHVRKLMDDYGATRLGISRAAGYGNVSVVNRVLDPTIRRPVPVAAARRLLSVTVDTLPDDARVWGRLARQLVDELAEAGLSRHQIAGLLGWSAWPGDDVWPSTRVRVGLVRTLQAAVDDVKTRCVDCGGRAMPGGGLQCLPCFQTVARPVRRGCGTEAGAKAHRRRGEQPCQACREGAAQAKALRKAGAA